MKLSAIRLFVHDLAGAKAFYTDTLGLRLTDDGSQHGYCLFENAGIQFIIEAVASDAQAEDQALVGRFVGVSFAVENINAEYSRLLALGVEFTGSPEKQFWGGALATFKDPAGNEIQLVQYGV